MFTGLTQVRRPSEKPPPEPQPKITERISPDSEKLSGRPRRMAENVKADAPAIVTAKAESEETPVPTHSGTGDTLPTIVSKKAHFVLPSDFEDTSEKARRKLVSLLDRHIEYPPVAIRNQIRWIGRNGTFNAIGLNLHKISDGRIRLVPHGKRGEAKNALIEFPVEVIPQIIEWLEGHRP